MEIKYKIADDKVCNFTESAKRRLQEQSEKYTLEVISEAEKVEKLVRENGASTEITDNILPLFCGPAAIMTSGQIICLSYLCSFSF